MDNNIIVIRTPQEIAAEINAIRRRAARQLLEDSVEVGRLLTEAKAAVNHGEWAGWLEENFQYSSTEANNLMRLWEAYGTREQIGLFEDNRTAIFGRLNKSQAIALLGIPEDARAAFVEANPPEDLSVREFERRIEEAKAETDAAVRKAVEAEEALFNARQAKKDAEEKMEEANRRAMEAEAIMTEHVKAVEESKKLKKQLAEARKLAEDRGEAVRKAEGERDSIQIQIDEIRKHPPVRDLTDEERRLVEDELRTALASEARKAAEEAVMGEIETLRAENEKLKLAADPIVQKFGRHFEAFREAYEAMKALIKEAQADTNTDTAERLDTALGRTVGAMAKEWRI